MTITKQSHIHELKRANYMLGMAAAIQFGLFCLHVTYLKT